jgi:signal transduction histidine kinase
MNNLVNTRLVSLFTKTSLILSVLVGIIGLLVMIGWMFDITLLKSITSNMIAMKPNAAIAFILISLILILYHKKNVLNKNLMVISKILTSIVILIGSLTLFENLSGHDLHIDQLLFQESPNAVIAYAPGRMAPLTSLVFLLIGIALIFLDKKRGLIISQILAFIIGFFGLLVLTSYAYHIETQTKLEPYIYAAFHAALNFVFIAIAILFLYPEQGMSRLLVSETAGGRIARLLLPIAIFIAPILGFFQALGVEIHLYDAQSGTAFLVLLTTAIFTTFVLIVAYMLMNSDLERQQDELVLKETLLNLERSNKELEQFAYIASHDLNEPLRMISSYTQLLERKYHDKLDKDAIDFIGFAVDGAHRMQLLIDDLLQYSRVTTKAQPLQPVDTNLLLDQTLINLQPLINEKEAEVTHDPLPTINADGIQIMQVFQNLISNAIKFCDQKPKIHISVKSTENEWIFSVKDNGIGIAPELHDQLFIIFRRLHTRDKYPGTGMGLAICKKIVERHKGRIWVESEVDKGTTFFFAIPK